MKYDDAGWHSGGDFPLASPAEFGATHIALMLKWCFTKGWAGELHTEDGGEDLEKMLRGELSATDYFFTWCDGKFTDEDLNAEGNAFIRECYDAYLGDYSEHFADEMYVVDEAGHDFARFSAMVEARYQSFAASTAPGRANAEEPGQTRSDRRPWWQFW